MATTSAPHETLDLRGRPGNGAAAARTEELYSQYARIVSGLCGALLRNRAETEDAVQQTFLSAHRALVNGAQPRDPAAWLATIARNECWARIRGRMREPLAVSELDAVSDRNDPLVEAIRRADLAALWAAIEELPRAQRDALLLREFGGLSYGELGEALAVSGPAVESLLFRARHRLRLQLRAAFASFGGASWLEALGRLLGGAPVAAKVAAIGLGAATVTGGAVVVPHVLEQGPRTLSPGRAEAPARPHVPGPRRPAATPPAASGSASAGFLLLTPVRSTPRRRAGETARRSNTADEGGAQARREGGDAGGSTGGEDGSEGGVATAAQVPAGQTQSGETQSGETQSGETQSGETETGQTDGGSRDEAGVTLQTATLQTATQPPAGLDGGSESSGGGSEGGAD